jgi:hypothetical protein
LRDDDGCVLAAEYEHNEKLAYILAAVKAHDNLLAASKAAWQFLTRLEYTKRNPAAGEATSKLSAAIALAESTKAT